MGGDEEFAYSAELSPLDEISRPATANVSEPTPPALMPEPAPEPEVPATETTPIVKIDLHNDRRSEGNDTAQQHPRNPVLWLLSDLAGLFGGEGGDVAVAPPVPEEAEIATA